MFFFLKANVHLHRSKLVKHRAGKDLVKSRTTAMGQDWQDCIDILKAAECQRINYEFYVDPVHNVGCELSNERNDVAGVEIHISKM